MKPFINTIGKGITPSGSGKEKVYVAFIFGQSNIDERIIDTGLPSDIINPSPRVKVFHNGEVKPWDYRYAPTAGTDSNNKYSADTLVLNRLTVDIEKDIYVVKNSRGNTGLFPLPPDDSQGDWNINSFDANDLFPVFKQRIIDMKNYIEITLKKEMVSTFLWADIGEKDCGYDDNKLDVRQYYKDFFQEVRDLVENQNLPIIHREISRAFIGSTKTDEWYNEMQYDFEAGEVVNYHLIKGQYSTFDGVHMDANGAEQYANNVLPVIKTFFP